MFHVREIWEDIITELIAQNKLIDKLIIKKLLLWKN